MGRQDELHGLAKGLKSLPHLQDLFRQLHHLWGRRRVRSEWSQDLTQQQDPAPRPAPTVPLTHRLPKLVQHVCVTRLTRSEGHSKQAVLCGPWDEVTGQDW